MGAAERWVGGIGEAHEVAPGLWVGSAPDTHDELVAFDMLVLCAVEWQPRRFMHFDGVLLRCPIEDRLEPISDREKGKVILAARTVSRALYDGNRVLVSCISGWNRSSLVAACALKMSTSLECEQIIEQIRRARSQDCLCNTSFCEYLCNEAPPC